MLRILRAVGWMTVCGFLATTLVAQEKKDGAAPEKKETGKEEAGAAGKQPGGQPDMEAMMAEMAEKEAPGEHHKHLDPFVGKWNLALKYRMSPEEPWSEEKSSAECEWMMGGRFLVQKVKGQGMGEGMPPFEGYGIYGYDNTAKKHTSMWIDNMSTIMMTADGTCSAGGKEVTFDSKFMDPMTGQPTHMKSVYKMESNDKIVLSMYGPDMTGKDFLSMEIVYTRAK